MRFIEIINDKKFTLLCVFLFLYVIINLFEGERGLISYYEKKNTNDQLVHEKARLVDELNLVEKKNALLTGTVDTDYLETMYRKKFMVGKLSEKIYIAE